MRPRSQISAAGFIVVILIAALGFASVTTKSPAEEPGVDASGALPDTLSARVLAASFAANLNPGIEQIEIDAAPAPSSVQPAATPRAAPETTTTTSTAPPPPPTTTTTTAAPTTTTTTPPVTTTTTSPPATTTTPPTTTAAPTTTTGPTTTTTTPPDAGGPRDVAEWRYLVEQYFSTELVDEALSVMRCESLGDPMAYNPASGASGLFQFIPSTWAWSSEGAGFGGASPFDPAANVGSAAWLVQRSLDQGKPAWTHWTCKP